MRLRDLGLCFLVTMLLLGTRPTLEAEPPKDAASNEGWTVLIGSDGLDAWKEPITNWEPVASVAVDPKNAKKLVGTPGKGVCFNGPGGFGSNLVTKEKFGDVEVHLEFNIPKGSNSGIKLEAVYEVQIIDSYETKKKLEGDASGGIYPRAELLPKYHHIDQGYAPKVNASRPPGQWQTLDIFFRAPRVDASGKKTENAKFVKVVLNGQVVQEDLSVPYPTGNNWHNKEEPTGPILLQGDHGAVAFRNVKVRPLRGS